MTTEHAEDDAELLAAGKAQAPAPEQPAPQEQANPPPALPATIAPVKAPVGVTENIMAIMPKTLDEAYRMAEAFVLAGMVPGSLEVWRNKSGEIDAKGSVFDQKATTARVMIVILKGMEVGFFPASALQTIMVVNNKPCIYGDGASALVNRSGVVEYIKTEIEGNPNIIAAEKADYKVTVTLKRRDQSEPIVRWFSYQDAIKAQLINKAGPWTNYRARQCYWRAWSWAIRDGASDALFGLSVAEEVKDYETEEKRNRVTDTSSLDDAPALEAPKQESANVVA